MPRKKINRNSEWAGKRTCNTSDHVNKIDSIWDVLMLQKWGKSNRAKPLGFFSLSLASFCEKPFRLTKKDSFENFWEWVVSLWVCRIIVSESGKPADDPFRLDK